MSEYHDAHCRRERALVDDPEHGECDCHASVAAQVEQLKRDAEFTTTYLRSEVERLTKERDEWANAIRTVAFGNIPSPVAARAAIAELLRKYETSRAQVDGLRAEVASAGALVNAARRRGAAEALREIGRSLGEAAEDIEREQ